MRTQFPSLRVTSLERSVAFYTRLGYRSFGPLDIGGGARLVMLKLPDEPYVSLELMHRPGGAPVDPGGLDHLAVSVEDLPATLRRLTDSGLEPGPPQWPAGADGPQTATLTDPDGFVIELVQWPPGHPDGLTEDELTADG